MKHNYFHVGLMHARGDGEILSNLCITLSEPRREKTGLRGFRPGPTQTDLYQLRKELEA